jgi:mannose-6-phosphate isomerase
MPPLLASSLPPLLAPLQFRPTYQTIVWGGRRMATWRNDLPDGPIGESWDLADHPRGMSVVAVGPHLGKSLRELTELYGQALVGPSFQGGDFPLLVKMIDANDRLSIQVHPDDELAQKLGVGKRGKTECWYLLSTDGELFVGTRPGITKDSFDQARKSGTLAATLNRFVTKPGDFFFIPARTVHALGAGCLIYEIQQTCDTTFRVDDWGRLGFDGKPRPLHVNESLTAIDFNATTTPNHEYLSSNGTRPLAQCPYFTVSEQRGQSLHGNDTHCTVVVCLSGTGTIRTAGGTVEISPMTTTLIPASAGKWTATAIQDPLTLLCANPI